MKAYKVTYKTFEIQHSFAISDLTSGAWGITSKEKFFATKEAAQKFCADKDEAAIELGLYPTLTANFQEVELE